VRSRTTASASRLRSTIGPLSSRKKDSPCITPALKMVVPGTRQSKDGQIEGSSPVSRKGLECSRPRSFPHSLSTLIGSRHAHIIPPRNYLPIASQSIILIGDDRHSLLGKSHGDAISNAFFSFGVSCLARGRVPGGRIYFAPGNLPLWVFFLGLDGGETVRSVGGGVILRSYIWMGERLFERHLQARILVAKEQPWNSRSRCVLRDGLGEDIETSWLNMI
jgi:hypothetical protein